LEKNQMNIVFMGTPDFAALPLDLMMQNGIKVTAVYTQPDRSAGRGRSLAMSPVKQVAFKWSLPVYQPENFKTDTEKDRLRELRPDVVIVAAYGQILPKSILELPRFGCLNLHPSLLPQYRGVAPVPTAILHGDEFTGISIMKLDQGVDTGPVIAQGQVRITDWDTTGFLTEKLSRIGAQVLLDILPRWISGRITPRLQDNSRATYTRMIEKEVGEIDWRQPSVEIWRKVRAYQPWPGSYTKWQGKQLKIIEAVPVDVQSSVPGRVVYLSNDAFGIETGLDILGIKRIQMEGKKIISAEEFLRGQRKFIGAVLPGNMEGGKIDNT
jgi:methionyl-tRNA formyltransferase